VNCLRAQRRLRPPARALHISPERRLPSELIEKVESIFVMARLGQKFREVSKDILSAPLPESLRRALEELAETGR
jgi:hypothetical protein